MILKEIFEKWSSGAYPEKSINFSGLTGSALGFTLVQAFRQLRQSILVILPTPKEVLALQEELKFFLGSGGDIFQMPPLGVLPYYGLSPNPETVAGRLGFLYALRQRRDPFIGIVSISALMRRLPPSPNLSGLFRLSCKGRGGESRGALKETTRSRLPKRPHGGRSRDLQPARGNP